MSLRDVLVSFWNYTTGPNPVVITANEDAEELVDEFIENAQVQLPVVDGPYLHQLTKKLREKRLLTNCMDCAYFMIEKDSGGLFGVCDMYGQAPPLNFVITGCEKWEHADDGLPL